MLNTASMEIRDQTLDATKARERLGWRAAWTLDDGLRETVGWYRSHLPSTAAGGRLMLRDKSSSPAAEALRAEILEQDARLFPRGVRARTFAADEDVVPVSGRAFDERELVSLVDSSLDFWLTTGRYALRFEREFARWFGIRECVLVNSGSSANLCALMALTSPELGERRLRPGDEVITAAAGFPTTVNPIVQAGCVPVFVDSELQTYNADLTQFERALSPKTRAVIIAHTLGNPYDPRSRARLLPQARALDDRGYVRRGRRDVERAAGRNVRRPRDGQLLPGPPHDDGRGRRRPDALAEAAQDRRVVS